MVNVQLLPLATDCPAPHPVPETVEPAGTVRLLYGHGFALHVDVEGLHAPAVHVDDVQVYPVFVNVHVPELATVLPAEQPVPDAVAVASTVSEL